MTCTSLFVFPTLSFEVLKLRKTSNLRLCFRFIRGLGCGCS